MQLNQRPLAFQLVPNGLKVIQFQIQILFSSVSH